MPIVSEVASSKQHLRTRFAPTPSGYLHWGNAFSFVLTWLIARKHDGKILLRIDDLDASRKRPEFVEDIFRSIDWLGLDFDEGPTGPDELEKRFSQFYRRELYQEKLTQLKQSDDLFACRCTRSSIQRAEGGLHPGTCRDKKTSFESPDVAWRMATSEMTPVAWSDVDGCQRVVELHDTMRDVVVLKKDRTPSYQLASLVDDLHFEMNFIVRGVDLLDSTAAQRVLAKKLEQTPFLDADFLHHDLVTDEVGEKLSKSAGATSLKAMRESSAGPTEVYRRLSDLLGLDRPVGSAREALAAWTT